MNKIPDILPSRIIITDDPLRAKMLIAHYLEYANLINESGDILLFSGSYKDVPIALASTGFGSSAVLSFLRGIIKPGETEVVYLGCCVSATRKHELRTVVLASGGSQKLLSRACQAAVQCEVPTTLQAVQAALPPKDANLEEGYIINDITCALYEQARSDGIEALSVLTVSENTKTGDKMEDHEKRSRLYAAAHLAFEMLALE